MIVNAGKTTTISFTRKTISVNFNYILCINFILRSQRVKDTGVLLTVSSIFITTLTTHFLKPKNVGFDLLFLHSAYSLCFIYHPRTIQIGIRICYLELHYINGFFRTRKSSKKIFYLMLQKISVGVCCNNHEGVSARMYQHPIPGSSTLLHFYLLMYFEAKLVVLPYLILSAYGYTYRTVVPKVWGAPPPRGARDPQGGCKRCETVLFTKNKYKKQV
jgi:hypothetical protein